MSSRGQLAKRAFVKVLLALAASYGLLLHLNRDSADDAVSSAFRRAIKRVHPDKGGAVADAQRLQTATLRFGNVKLACRHEAVAVRSIVSIFCRLVALALLVAIAQCPVC